MSPLSKDKFHVKLSSETEKIKGEGNFISLFNMYLKILEDFLGLVFVFNT
jgi:hypothetical protein